MQFVYTSSSSPDHVGWIVCSVLAAVIGQGDIKALGKPISARPHF